MNTTPILRKTPEPPCAVAWGRVMFHTDFAYRPCCYLGGPSIGSYREGPIDEVFNGPEYIRLRTLLLQGKYDEAGCGDCLFRNLRDIYDFRDQFPMPAQPGPALDNYLLAEREFQEGKVRLTAKPVEINLFFSNDCNLRCIMCPQDHSDLAQRFPMDRLQAILDAWYPTLSAISIQGGEPLFIPEVIDMLQGMDPDVNPECQIDFFTNAHLVEENIGLLRKFPRLSFGVSVDSAVPEVYESIRRRGKFDSLRANLDLLKAESEVRDWAIRLSSVVMRRNAHTLVETGQFADSYGFDMQFAPIFGYWPKENFYLYNWLTDEVEGDFAAHLQALRAYAADSANPFTRERTKAFADFTEDIALIREPRVTRDFAQRIEAEENGDAHRTNERLQRIFLDKNKALRREQERPAA